MGDNAELPRLIGYGEIDGAEHIPSEEIERDLSVRNDFLRAHGFSEIRFQRRGSPRRPVVKGQNHLEIVLVLLTRWFVFDDVPAGFLLSQNMCIQ